ncbi:hypothetical protein [Leucobacter sp. W1153]|uniref:hypothetical protein n=1 Tax=unclassified Leucobacter TaxID=2621730 RepID=UPI003F2B3D9A
MAEPRKRAAIEPAAALVERETAVELPSRRPATTVLGAIFVLTRALAGLLWLGAFLLVWPEIVAEEGFDAEEARIGGWLISSVSAAGIIALLLLAWLIWRGSNIARILVMCGLTLSISTSAVGYFALGEEITIRTTLMVLALDILVLLALSSRDSRTWARRRRFPRHRTN